MYGTAEGVAALSAQWTSEGEWLDDGVYDEATSPSLTEINDWLDRVSSMVDVRLSDAGFITPVNVAEAVKDLSLLVEGIVKDLADYSHGSGRYYSKQAIESGTSPYLTIDKEISAWVERRQIGLAALGVPMREDVDGRNMTAFEVM